MSIWAAAAAILGVAIGAVLVVFMVDVFWYWRRRND